MKSAWVRISKAAKLMGMSRQGATKRLLRLQKATGTVLLRRVGEGDRAFWEVNLSTLKAVHDGGADSIDRELDTVRSSISYLSAKVDALKVVSRKHRQELAQKIEEMSRKLEGSDRHSGEHQQAPTSN